MGSFVYLRAEWLLQEQSYLSRVIWVFIEVQVMLSQEHTEAAIKKKKKKKSYSSEIHWRKYTNHLNWNIYTIQEDISAF